MNDQILKKLEIKINNLSNLRTMYYSIAIVLTGGIIGLLYNLNILNLLLFITGSFADFFMILSIIKLSIRIEKLIKFIERN